jgi:CubicO group peptidase (beta-lactamase class C family)
VLLERGYGVSDTATGAPVDPRETLFRPGSVSKLFTWTALMQLVEAGKVDLDADVNTYLDFKIPPLDGKPITVRNLMTHTPGFEETLKGLFVNDPKNIPTLEASLKRWVPERIFPAGTTPAYSNYGAALAGYIVERVSGQKFDAYVADHIFKPLGMTHSTFSQPLPPALAGKMAKGYENGVAQPYELVPMAPAGSLAASGADMGKFMIAHLGGAGADAMLRPETRARMHTEAYPVMPPLNAMVLGFFQNNINGHRAIGHGGDTGVFHSDLNLFIDDNIGMFVSLNGAGQEGATGAIRSYLFEGFADRYLPGPRPVGQVDAKTAAEHAALMAGQTYVFGRGSRSNFIAALNLVSQSGFIVNDDGTISPTAFPGYDRQPQRYRETSPFVWDAVDGHGRIAAKVVDGKVVMWSQNELAPAFAILPAPQSGNLLLSLMGAALAVILVTALAWPITAIVRRRYRAAFPLPRPRALGYRLTRLLSWLCLAAVGGWIYIGVLMSSSLDGLFAMGKRDGLLLAVEAASLLTFGALLLAALYNLVAVWRHGGGWFAKLWSLLLVAAPAIMLYIFWTFRMINFSTNY